MDGGQDADAGLNIHVKQEPEDDEMSYQNNIAVTDDETETSEVKQVALSDEERSQTVVKDEQMELEVDHAVVLPIGSIKRASPLSIAKERLKKKLKTRIHDFEEPSESAATEPSSEYRAPGGRTSPPNCKSNVFICVCHKEFPSQMALRTHVYMTRCPVDVNEILEAMPHCTLCGASVPSAGISCHVAACHKERPYVCSVCGHGFKYGKFLPSHFQSHHWLIWEQVSMMVRGELAAMLNNNLMYPSPVVPHGAFAVPGHGGIVSLGGGMPYGHPNMVVDVPRPRGGEPGSSHPGKSLADSMATLRHIAVRASQDSGMLPKVGSTLLADAKNPKRKAGVRGRKSHTPVRKEKGGAAEKRSGSTGDEDSGVENVSMASENLGSPSEVSSTPSGGSPELPDFAANPDDDQSASRKRSALAACSPDSVPPTWSDTTPRDSPADGRECGACGFRFSSAELYLQHVSECQVERPHLCQHCGRGFARAHYLAMHIRKTHTPCACKICSEKFHDESELDQHMRSHVVDRPFKCDYCGKGFNHASDRTRHMRIHTGEKPYTCKDCGKGFTDSSNYINHKRIHTGEKPYKCDHCPKRFTFSSAKTSHMRIHTGERPYQCVVCFKSFTMAHCLTRHMKSQHVREQHAKIMADTVVADIDTVKEVKLEQE